MKKLASCDNKHEDVKKKIFEEIYVVVVKLRLTTLRYTGERKKPYKSITCKGYNMINIEYC